MKRFFIACAISCAEAVKEALSSTNTLTHLYDGKESNFSVDMVSREELEALLPVGVEVRIWDEQELIPEECCGNRVNNMPCQFCMWN